MRLHVVLDFLQRHTGPQICNSPAMLTPTLSRRSRKVLRHINGPVRLDGTQGRFQGLEFFAATFRLSSHV